MKKFMKDSRLKLFLSKSKELKTNLLLTVNQSDENNMINIEVIVFYYTF